MKERLFGMDGVYLFAKKEAEKSSSRRGGGCQRAKI